MKDNKNEAGVVNFITEDSLTGRKYHLIWLKNAI